jgi:hypothetical protein
VYTAQVDALCYVERETIIRRLPIELCGLRAIRMCNLDSETTDENFLTITLDKPGRVYVAYASAATRRPKWLRDFENEDKKVDVIDEWWGVKELQVFSREFDAGTITLGANRADGAEGKCDPHYLVFIEG